MAYQGYCRAYKNKVKHHKTPQLALKFLRLGVEPHQNQTELAWVQAINQYKQTKNNKLTLYDRCRAEVAMRRHWNFFKNTFMYKEPSIPPLPED